MKGSDKLNSVSAPLTSESLEKFGTSKLGNCHKHDAEIGKALEDARSGLAKQAITRKDAFETRRDRRLDKKFHSLTPPTHVHPRDVLLRPAR